MKKLSWLLFLLFISLNGLTQTCEEREIKLQKTLNGIHAGFLYNTYGLIGSIADGFNQEAYSAEQVSDLLKAQVKMTGNMAALLERMLAENAFASPQTKAYLMTSVPLIRGLGTQAELFLKVVSNNNKKNTAAYEEQRNQNWKDLSKLMGIQE